MNPSDGYYGRVFRRACKETREVWNPYRLTIAVASLVSAVALIVLANGWSANSLISIRMVSISACAAVIVGIFAIFAVSLGRSARLLDIDHASDVEILSHQLNTATREIERLQLQIAAPSVVLRFDDIPRKPQELGEDGVMHSYWKESELLAINESNYGAYEVWLTQTKVGAYTISGYTPVDVPKGERKRIPYRVVKYVNDVHQVSLGYEHHLRDLLHASYSDDNLISVPLVLVFKDDRGRSWKAEFRLLHHPQSRWLPRIDIESGPRLVAENSDGPSL